MTLSVVARKDFRDAVRSKTLWALTALFVLFATGATYVYSSIDVFRMADLATIGLIGVIRQAGAFLVPIIALLVGYKAVAGERESGSLKLLLGFPHSRSDVVYGKLLGRSLVVAVPIVVGYLLAGVLAVATFDTFQFVDYALFVGLTVLFGVAYTSVAVGFSSAMRSTRWAAALAFGVWFVFQIGWDIITTLVLYFANDRQMPMRPGDVPDWYVLLTRIAPDGAYATATELLAPGEAARSAFYLQEWFGVVILLFWVVVPVTLGYWRFDAADL